MFQCYRNLFSHDTNLRELNFGVWDGMAFNAVAKRDPDLSRAYWENPGDTAPPEGESWNACNARVSAVVDRLSKAHPEAHIIAVAHFGVILTQVQRALDLTGHAAIGHKIDNLSVTPDAGAGHMASRRDQSPCVMDLPTFHNLPKGSWCR